MLIWTLHRYRRETDLTYSGLANREMLKVTIKSLHFSFLSSVDAMRLNSALWDISRPRTAGGL